MRTASRVAACAAALLMLSCGRSPEPEAGTPAASTAPAVPGTITSPPPAETSTNLDKTPLSAADYAMYAAIMGGASAMLADMGPDDRAALELEKRVQAGAAKQLPGAEQKLARARELHRTDEELARLQGIDGRYLKVKEKVEAVIGSRARPPAPDDGVAKENLRFLEAHRHNIERLQRILADPLSRDPAAVQSPRHSPSRSASPSMPGRSMLRQTANSPGSSIGAVPARPISAGASDHSPGTGGSHSSATVHLQSAVAWHRLAQLG